jgi:diguanylate cyclase (GGDEF)-like protein
VPVVVGVHDYLDGPTAGFVLAAQGALTATLVMVRIGLLSAERNRAEDALAHQATHDQLTGLANRRQFVACLRDELARDRLCVVLFCDLDGFKAVNDRYGHEAGDQLLVQVAQRLRRCVPAPGMVSRFGGDEFVVLLVDTTASAAQATRDRIERTLDQPYQQVHNAQIGTSIGLTATDGERDPEVLLRTADRAMYREKATHRRSS